MLLLALLVLSGPALTTGVAHAESAPTRSGGVAQYRLAEGERPAAVRPVKHPYLADYTLDIGGRERSYRVFVPTGLVGPAPYVVAMTGLSMTGDPENYMHWRALAQRKHFVVLQPRGYGASWNAGVCCGKAVRDGVNDREALTAMIASASHVYPLNTHRLYLVGFSNGGMMALDYACRYPERVAGVGVVSAAFVSRCRATKAVPVMHVHGGRDQVLPVRGGWSRLLTRRVPSYAGTLRVFDSLDRRAGVPQRTVLLAQGAHDWQRRDSAARYDTTGRLLAYLWPQHR